MLMLEVLIEDADLAAIAWKNSKYRSDPAVIGAPQVVAVGDVYAQDQTMGKRKTNTKKTAGSAEMYVMMNTKVGLSACNTTALQYWWTSSFRPTQGTTRRATFTSPPHPPPPPPPPQNYTS